MLLKSPANIYRLLSQSNKVHFWAVSINCFVVFFTFWIGLTYQFLVVEDSTYQSSISSHVELVREYDNISRNISIDNTLLQYRLPYLKIRAAQKGFLNLNGESVEQYNDKIAKILPDSSTFYTFIKDSENKLNSALALRYSFNRVVNDTIKDYCEEIAKRLLVLRIAYDKNIETKEDLAVFLKVETNDSRLTNDVKNVFIINDNNKSAFDTSRVGYSLSELKYRKNKIFFETIDSIYGASRKCVESMQNILHDPPQKGISPFLLSTTAFLILLILVSIVWWVIINGVFKERNIPNLASSDDRNMIASKFDELQEKMRQHEILGKDYDYENEDIFKTLNLIITKNLNQDEDKDKNP